MIIEMTIHPIAAAITSSSPGYAVGYSAGYWLSCVVIVGALVAGIVKCCLIARRPTTSAKALSSLIILLGAWAMMGAFTPLLQRSGPTPVRSIVAPAIGLLMAGSIVASIVMAILGLIDCARRRDIYKQGAWQAVSALSVNALFIAFMVAAFFSNARSRSMASSQRSAPVIFTNLNFSLALPGRPWTHWNAERINPNATFAMMRLSPGMFFMVIGEVLGAETTLTAETYSDLVRTSIRSRAESVVPLGERHMVRKGVDGVEMETRATLAPNEIHYVHRLIVTNGYAYQIFVWGDPKERRLIRTEAESIFSGFSLLEPARVAGSSRPKLAYRSEAHHFEATLPAGWSESRTRDKDFREADFMASHPQGVPFAIVPLDLRGEEISDDALIKALLGSMSFKYPSEQIVAESRTAHEWGTIFRFECERELNGQDFDYSLVLVRRARYAYLMAAWNSTSRTNTTAVREAAFASFRPLVVPETVEPITRLSRSQRQTQASFWNELGLDFYEQSHFEKSARLFGLAAEYAPGNGIYVANQVKSLANLGKAEEALAVMKQRLPLVRDGSASLLASEAALEEEVGRPDQAVKTYAALFKTGYRSENSFTAYLTLLAEENKLDQALFDADAYLQKGDSLAVRLVQAALLRRKKEFPRSIDLLKTAQNHWPGNPELTLSLGESFVQSGAHKEATDLVQRLVREGHDSVSLYYLKGRAELGLKAYRDAKASFEKALQKAPASSDIRGFLAEVSGLLGEGSNSEIKEPIARVDIPKGIIEVPGTLTIGTNAPGHGARYLKRIVAHSLSASNLLKTTEYLLVDVLDRSGVNDLSTLQFSFDPLQESVYVNSLKVKDNSGSLQATGKLSDYYVLDDAGARSVSQRKVLNIPVPNLQPGSRIELMLTRQSFGSVSNFPYTQHYFSMTVPTVQSILLVLGDTNRLRFKASPSLQPKEIEGGLCWTVNNPPIVRFEPLQPPPSEYLPFLRVGDARTSWEKESGEYRAAIRNRFEISDAVRQVASNLVGRLTNSEAKVVALSRFVQSNLTYKPIEFGRRARIPQLATEILGNRYGDCKDHSLLLVQLAEAAGVSAQLALVNTRHSIEKEVPSLDQFDHMIVYVPNVHQGLFVDCTDKGSDLSSPVPLGLGGKEALVLDEKASRFVSIAAYKDEASRIYSERTISMTNSSDFAVSETLKMTGPIAGVLRSWLRETEASSRIRFLQSQLSSPADIDNLEVGDLERTDQPLELRISYSLRRQLQSFDNRLVGQLPCLFERTYLALAPLNSRSSPVQVTIPLGFESHVKFKVPEGYALSPITKSAQRLPERFATCQSSVLSQTNQTVVDWKAERRIGTFPPSDYAAFRSALDDALLALSRTVVLTKIEL